MFLHRFDLRTRRGLYFEIVPTIPNTPVPANGQTLGVSPTLGWQAWGATSYDVYFGTSPTPPLVSSGQPIALYPTGIAPTTQTTYYWQIVAYNQAGSTAGPVWSFVYQPPPEPITDASTTLLRNDQIRFKSDMSQQISRVYVRGAGGTIAADAPAGSTTIDVQGAPIGTFSAGQAQVGCQRISYVSAVDGSDLAPDPTRIGAATNTPDVLGELVVGATYRWAYSFQRDSDGRETGLSPETACIITVQGASGSAVNIDLTQCDEAPAGYTRCWYRTGANGSDFVRLPVLYPLMGNQFHYAYDRDPGNIVLFDGVGDAWRGFVSTAFRSSLDPPAGNKPPIDILSWVAGDPTVIESIGNHNLTNNDWVSILGAGASLNGKSKVTVVDPTHFSVPVNSRAAGAGGQFQQQVFYYAEESYSTPHQDPSSVQFLFPYNQHFWTLTPDPFPRVDIVTLKGVTGITHTLVAGKSISLFLQYDDAAVQTALGLQEGGDGIREYMVVNTSLPTYVAMEAVARVFMTQRGYPIKSVTYSTLDQNTRKNALVNINLTNPPIVVSTRIQSVRIDQIHDVNENGVGRGPRYTATASSIKFDINDLLRKIFRR